ncbi:MAG: ATP-dependent sacrificial sulfur transferase LarE [Gemmatimonadales bacterium]
MSPRHELEAWYRAAGRTLLGYSGGVDSAVLAVVGVEALGADFLAVIGRSASYPAVQWETALAVARDFGVPVLEVATEELADDRYRANNPDRCYFCKTELWSRLHGIAAERGFGTIVDGTNTDDLGDHRPGAAAGRERGIRSPFLDLGWSKARVREVARELGLPVWDAPAAPCLSSRIAYGLEVTADRLRQVELGEAFLRTLGVRGDLRVRHHGSRARVEVARDQLAGLANRWPEVEARFAELGFTHVDLDPAGYRRGSLLPIAS